MNNIKLFLSIFVILSIIIISFVPYKIPETFQINKEELNRIVTDAPKLQEIDVKNVKTKNLKTDNIDIKNWKHGVGNDYELKKGKTTHIKILGNKEKTDINTKNLELDGNLSFVKPSGWKKGEKHTISMGNNKNLVETTWGDGIKISSEKNIKLGNDVTITKDGLVGVGTDEPNNKLDVQGWMRIGDHRINSTKNGLRICNLTEGKNTCTLIK